MKPALYIVYNANSTPVGKLHYAYRKLTTPASAPSPCAACDLTHGGLRLTETAEWAATKTRIGAEVEQLHRDELGPEVKKFLEDGEINLPVVVGRSRGGEGGKAAVGDLKVLLQREELGRLSKDHEAFLAALKESAERQGIDVRIAEKTGEDMPKI